jgi:hypothetical protein
MKRRDMVLAFFAASLAGLVPVEGSADPEYGLAAGYPHDIGIESDAAVVFTENFEESSVDDVVARWEDVIGQDVMSLAADVPAESDGSQSLYMAGGGHLYRRIEPGQDILYVRFYAKLDPSCNNVHHWVWMGGHNPTTAWPWPRAGERPAGDERWSTGIEPMGDSWAWDFYTYWMHMRTNPDGRFWGNTFSGRPSPYPAVRGEWACVEFMVKLNDPVDSYNGEQAFWIEGERKNHLGPGFPRGEWIWDGFYPNPGCTPSGPCDPDGSSAHCCTDFEGFQWRTTTDLDINYVWLEHYVDSDPGCEVWFDDVVVATEYIGPMVGDVPPDVAPDTPPDAPPDEQPDVSPDALPDPADAVTDGVDAPPPDGTRPDIVSDGADAPADAAGEGEGGGEGCGCSVAR